MFNRGVIDCHTRDFLSPSQLKTARLYLLPKIHKRGNPGRPIVSSNGTPTEKISRFIDHYLQPLVTGLPSPIRDTTDFLNKLRRLPPLPPGSLLVTLDVSSLYTNIPHDEAFWHVRRYSIQGPPHNRPMPPHQTHSHQKLLHLQWRTLPAAARHSHGNSHGTIICQPVHGKVGVEFPTNPGQAAPSLVAVHR